MKPDRQLPPDLARLGAQLEEAARETLRRRQRRQAMANFVATVALALPFALAVAASDLSPADGPLPRATPVAFETTPPPNVFAVVRHVPDQPLTPPTKDRCPDAQDCRAPVLYPATPGQR